MASQDSQQPRRVMFIYLGRRGLSRFVLDFARAATAEANLEPTFVVSRQNEIYSSFAEFGEAVVAVDTFGRNAGALLESFRIPWIRARLRAAIARRRPEAVVELMPHVWSSLIAPVIKRAGVRYVPVIHDGDTHPGDYRSRSIAWAVRRTLRQADAVLTLSNAVAERLCTMSDVSGKPVAALLHPDLDYGFSPLLDPPRAGEPLRLIFFGRILAYKGLPLFCDMAEELRRRGVHVEVGVFGEGELGRCADRLAALGAEVVNRWLAEEEIATLLPRYHAVVLSHVEASQSGVAAAAFAAGLPVIATPVGGLCEQITHLQTGLLADRVDATALADAVVRLRDDAALHVRIRTRIADQKERRSMKAFAERCVARALD